jgi:1,4-alpha-glucan branching enzyme
MHKFCLLVCLLVLTNISFSQYVSLSPASAGPNDEVTVTFDASQGNKELVGASKVYMHHGIVIDKPDGIDWKNVKGNWGKDDGIGSMTKVIGTDKWTIKLSPTVRQYFNASSTDKIFRISCVFRNADGSKKGTASPGSYGWGQVLSNQDVYINLLSPPFASINSPAGTESFLSQGEKLAIKASASVLANIFKIYIDEGNGFVEKISKTDVKDIEYDYTPKGQGKIKIKIESTINGQLLTEIKEHNIIFKNTVNVASLPVNVIPGINYNKSDFTKATLVLEAPKKDFVYVIGDMNNWETRSEYNMNKTPDGQYFWLELKDLQPSKKYIFQYFVNGNLKIADPYSEIIIDPNNDAFLDSDVKASLPIYTKPSNGIASILQTDQEKYSWTNNEKLWKKPNADHLVIYELHLRDFIGKHDFNTLIDTISYIKKLGVNAIEFMPLGEFDGNDSWGYNPSFHMALDKYYGKKNELKKLIDVCHQNGIAVLLDIVFNHAYGQSPLYQLYSSGNQVASDNPWFNVKNVGPFDFGYDFNHESTFTQRFMDQVNKYWLEEYHFDGFRFDFTKGFTNNAPNNNLDNFDQSRINILKRMIGQIKSTSNDAIIILEHFGNNAEESDLSTTGAKLWRNKSYDYVPAANGVKNGNFNNMNETTHVAYFNSHDERRIAEHMLSEGQSFTQYDVKRKPIALERTKLIAAFTYLFPGPKMIWQFDELGYDIDINFNGRVGRKPLPWGSTGNGYYENTQRKSIYEAYSAIVNLRNKYTPEKMSMAKTNHQLTGDLRQIVYDFNDDDLVIFGNFGLKSNVLTAKFTTTGKWYDYLTGEEIVISKLDQEIKLTPGEWKIFTTKRYSNGFNNISFKFENPVTITPETFNKNDTIIIKFDAKKASKANTKGLVGAKKVYMHSGVIKIQGNDFWSNVVGNFNDNGKGLMTSVGDDIWEIKFSPKDYYNLGLEEISQLAMYFRDEKNENLGKGFMDLDIYYNVESNLPFLTVNPSKFNPSQEITISFNASQGNKELLGQDFIYMHSSIDVTKTDNPAATAWNKVRGNWGKDDGIGKMIRVGNSNIYQIKIVPQVYYGLTTSDSVFWIAAVFRNADGSKKGTGAPGPLPNGFIADNQDFFIKNDGKTEDPEIVSDLKLKIFPNPSQGTLMFDEELDNADISLYNEVGQLLYQAKINGKRLSLPETLNGFMFYKIKSKIFDQKGLLMIIRK